jgi:hypothetical protein
LEKAEVIHQVMVMEAIQQFLLNPEEKTLLLQQEEVLKETLAHLTPIPMEQK